MNSSLCAYPVGVLFAPALAFVCPLPAAAGDLSTSACEPSNQPDLETFKAAWYDEALKNSQTALAQAERTAVEARLATKPPLLRTQCAHESNLVTHRLSLHQIAAPFGGYPSRIRHTLRLMRRSWWPIKPKH